MPPHTRVHHIAIRRRGTQGGFAATLIEKSDRVPHQNVVDSKYYMRAGSAFTPVPHSVLAGMFGRRPQPDLFHMYTLPPARLTTDDQGNPAIGGSLGIMLGTNGPVICRDLFLNIKLKLPGKCELEVVDKTNWNGHFAFGMLMSLHTRDGYKVAPGSFVQPTTLHWVLTPPFSSELWVELVFGCDGAPPRRVTLETPQKKLQSIFDEFSRKRRDTKYAQSVTATIFSIPSAQVEKRPPSV